jgi:hypothetical protein
VGTGGRNDPNNVCTYEHMNKGEKMQKVGARIPGLPWCLAGDRPQHLCLTGTLVLPYENHRASDREPGGASILVCTCTHPPRWVPPCVTERDVNLTKWKQGPYGDKQERRSHGRQGGQREGG